MTVFWMVIMMVLIPCQPIFSDAAYKARGSNLSMGIYMHVDH